MAGDDTTNQHDDNALDFVTAEKPDAFEKSRPPLKLAEPLSRRTKTATPLTGPGEDVRDDASSLLSNRRRQPRRSVLWPARLTVGRHEVTCQVWNLSLGGARIRCDLPLRSGSPVSLRLAGQPSLDAFVSWSEGDSLGLQFVDSEDTIKKYLEDRLHAMGMLDED